MAKEEQKQSTLGTPMPSNAAGEWRKFDAEDKATWPTARIRYLVWCASGYSITSYFIDANMWRATGVFDANIWRAIGVIAYAEILPPESRGE